MILASGIGKTSPRVHHLTSTRDDHFHHVQPGLMDAIRVVRQIIFSTTKFTKDPKKSQDSKPFVVFVSLW